MPYMKQIAVVIFMMCWATQGLAQPTRANFIFTGGVVSIFELTNTTRYLKIE